jgi:hypothetical protein
MKTKINFMIAILVLCIATLSSCVKEPVQPDPVPGQPPVTLAQYTYTFTGGGTARGCYMVNDQEICPNYTLYGGWQYTFNDTVGKRKRFFITGASLQSTARLYRDGVLVASGALAINYMDTSMIDTYDF